MAKHGAEAFLFPGEEIALIGRQHVIVLIRPALLPLLGIALLLVRPRSYTALVFLVAVARFSWDYAKWWLDRYVLTSDRILSTSGILTKRMVSIPLAKITDLTYSRSLPGRLLGYGTLDLESAGQQGLERIEFLPNPDVFYRTVMLLSLGPRPGNPGGLDESDNGDGSGPRAYESPVSRLITQSDADVSHAVDVNTTQEIPVIRLRNDKNLS